MSNLRASVLLTKAANQISLSGPATNIFLFDTDLSPAGSNGNIFTVDLSNSKIIMKSSALIHVGGTIGVASDVDNSCAFKVLLNGSGIIQGGSNYEIAATWGSNYTGGGALLYTNSGDEIQFGVYCRVNGTLSAYGGRTNSILWAYAL